MMSPPSPSAMISDTPTPASPPSSSSRQPTSQLQAAADLIRTLDQAYAEMNSNAADAAKDAEIARRNSRAASEIARQYANQNHTHLPFLQFGEGLTESHTSQLFNSNGKGNSLPSTPTRSHLQGFHSSTSTDNNLTESNGFPPKLQTPTRSTNPFNSAVSSTTSKSKLNGLSLPSPTRNGRSGSTRSYHTPSTSDRIAQSHAEDVLTLSMELERAKQAFKSEQRMHSDTKSTLAGHKEKLEALEKQNATLVKQIEQLKVQAKEERQAMEQELAKSKILVQEAEEDAQVALELAKDSADKRDELESDLQRALEEVEALKGQLAQQQKLQQQQQQPPPPPSHPSQSLETPRRAVRFADMVPSTQEDVAASTSFTSTNTSISTSSPMGTPSRSMVATGRQLLRRSNISSPREEIIQLELTPAKAAQRRQRLREKLEVSMESESGQSPIQENNNNNTSSTTRPMVPVTTDTTILICQAAAKLVHESGKRLELPGTWWTRNHPHPPKIQEVESMTRQYCQLVEGKISQQGKDLKELESLCGFLEQRLVTGTK